MKNFFYRLSLLALMIVGGVLLTEIAFLHWSLPQRVIAKGFVWALVMILANHALENKKVSLRV